MVDTGVGLTWLATDFERNDDVGVPSHPSTDISCASFPLGVYALEDVAKGAGNIRSSRNPVVGLSSCRVVRYDRFRLTT